jgi:hypothetical protein
MPQAPWYDRISERLDGRAYCKTYEWIRYKVHISQKVSTKLWSWRRLYYTLFCFHTYAHTSSSFFLSTLDSAVRSFLRALSVYMGEGKDCWQSMTATPHWRGQVMSFSKNAVICLTKLKQASNGCCNNVAYDSVQLNSEETIRERGREWASVDMKEMSECTTQSRSMIDDRFLFL